MKWVTRERPKTDRIACPWLIQRFLDPDAEFLFVAPDEVLVMAESHKAIPFDLSGVELGHHEGKCSLEAFIEKYHLTDPALLELASIVHAADVRQDQDTVAQGAGLRAVGEGFLHLTQDDHELLRMQFPVYDALYAWCQERIGAEP